MIIYLEKEKQIFSRINLEDTCVLLLCTYNADEATRSSSCSCEYLGGDLKREKKTGGAMLLLWITQHRSNFSTK